MAEEQPKKKVDKTCAMCYHCRMRVSINLFQPLNTIITPTDRRDGLLYVYCRMNYWARIGKPRFLFTVAKVNKLYAACPYFTGEDDEEDNSALSL